MSRFLDHTGTDFSVRLRLSDWVTVDRVYATVSAHVAAGRLGVGQRTAAMIGRGPVEQPLVSAAIVVSAAVVAPPRHKQNPGTARERAHRAKQHAQHRKHKQGRKTTPPSAVAQRYAHTWVLFTKKRREAPAFMPGMDRRWARRAQCPRAQQDPRSA